ncbi:MAG: oligopeptide transporter, OPT family [Chlamydiota bacterium]
MDRALTDKAPREFSWRALFLGLLFSLVFALSNAYLALKIGTTISASIPAAILSMALMRCFCKGSTLLENNLVQTIATVGEGLAGGIVFTVPALFFLGAPPSFFEVFCLSSLGGILGILFMIPMRRFVVVEEHGKLPFPEGTACAEILRTGEKNRSAALSALWGLLAAVVYKLGASALHLWQEVLRFSLPRYQNTEITLDTTPALLGVGYIIGFPVAATIFSGSILAWFVLIPLITLFGTGQEPIYPAEVPVSAMDASMIWEQYVRYIGAGTIAFGGLLSLVRIAPLLLRTLQEGSRELRRGWCSSRKRIDTDIPFTVLGVGSLGAIALLWFFFRFDLTTIVLLMVLGFLFSTVTSLTVGIVGSTSNPVSGMVITTLLLTSMLFVFLGWTSRAYLISAITMSAVANVAICMASTTSQDLKTGFLLGATPYKQQIAEMIGTLLPSIALGFCLYLLNDAYTLGSPAMPAPQASMMAMIAKGVIHGQLPYTLFAMGMLLGIFLECLRVPVLPFALGVYLPFSLTSATMVGGILSRLLMQSQKAEQVRDQGVLFASGMVGGDACMGIVIAVFAILGLTREETLSFFPSYATPIAYAFLAVFFLACTYHRGKKTANF